MSEGSGGGESRRSPSEDRVIERVRHEIVKDYPFLTGTVFRLQWKVSQEVEVPTSDGRTIEIPPHPEVEGVAQCVLGVALDHHLRIQDRDPLIWNIASSIVTGEILADLHHLSANTKTVEEVYDELVVESGLPSRQGGKLEEDFRSLDLDSLGDEEARSKGSPTDPEGGSERTAGEKEKGNVDPPYELCAPKKGEEISHAALFRREFEVWGKQRGIETGGLSELHSIGRPKGRWKEIFQSMVSGVLSRATDWSYRKYNRRVFEETGIFVPVLDKPFLRVLYAIDTSGSMSTEELSRAASEVRGMVGGDVEVTIAPTDCTVYEEAHVTIAPYDPLPETIDLPGRGGTAYTPILRWAKEKELNGEGYDLVVVFTDGHGDDPEEEDFPQAPVIWITTGPYLSATRAQYVVEVDGDG